MNRKFIYHNGTSIKKEFILPDNQFLEQELAAANCDQDYILEVDLDFDSTAHKIVNGKPELFDNKDKCENRKKIFENYFKFNGKETNTEIDKKINDFFFGQIDVPTWKLENYAFLRRFFYPNIYEYVDAMVKINTGDKNGQDQLSNYFKRCMEVKNRFPKLNQEVK